MRRYRKGDTFRPPTAAESAASADALEGFRRQSAQPQGLPPRDGDIVKTPSDGIPARDGTTIYSAACLRCIESHEADEKTITETDEELPVFNLETTAVAGGIYARTGLTMGGTRCIVQGGGATGPAIIRFAILELECDLCRATAQVLSSPTTDAVWGETTESVFVEGRYFTPPRGYGEWIDLQTVTVYDLAGCHLKKPEDDLLYKIGYAAALIGQRHEDCESDYDAQGLDIQMRWEIMSICCDEFRCQD